MGMLGALVSLSLLPLTTKLLLKVDILSATVVWVFIHNVTVLPTTTNGRVLSQENLTRLPVSGVNPVTLAKLESHVVPLLVFGY